MANTWSFKNVLGYGAIKYKHTSKSKVQNHKTMISKGRPNNSGIITESIYGSDCPANPHKQTLKYLFNYWMSLDNYYNLSSFLCGGSLIGSLRDGDLIPYDRDIDVCVLGKIIKKCALFVQENRSITSPVKYPLPCKRISQTRIYGIELKWIAWDVHGVVHTIPALLNCPGHV